MTIRFWSTILSLGLLLILQVSFIFALPFPFDRLPLVLVIVIYLYQYQNTKAALWGLICYGFVLDVLGISPAPLEILSYTITSLVLTLLVTHVFTNRSFYGMLATAIICLAVLTMFELLFSAAASFFSGDVFMWQGLLASQVWTMAFSCVLILFLFPLMHRTYLAVSHAMLRRL